jgi:hypothetical protein
MLPYYTSYRLHNKVYGDQARSGHHNLDQPVIQLNMFPAIFLSPDLRREYPIPKQIPRSTYIHSLYTPLYKNMRNTVHIDQLHFRH